MRKLLPLLPALATALTAVGPAIAQKDLEPIRPPGEGWVHAYSVCQSSTGKRDEYCPNGTYYNGRFDWARQEWIWFRKRPFPGSSQSRARYEYGITDPRSGLKYWDPRQVTVKCDTWEIYFHTDLPVEVDWKPITPDSWSETFAEVSCP